MKEFIKLEKYGHLYIDKVLFESYFPIIFTCVNDNKDIFICVCCQNNEKGCKWLLGKTDGISIVKILKDEMTIRQLLLENSSGNISVDYVKNTGYVVAYDNSDWDVNSPYLPKEDSYMYAEDGEFEDEINYFSSLNYCISYNKEYYKSLDTLETIKTISKGIEPVTEALAQLTLAVGTISIPSEIVSTLKVFGKLCANLVITTEKYTNQGNYKSVYDESFSVVSEDLSIKVESENNNYYADAA
ncbi:hypothetical protein C817_02078 [Dorea sp. 5-2]|nr:hypothetical protein C817_02078 [Dorea sp. 5-2]